MGTHPIFESDFDCLTEKMRVLSVAVLAVVNCLYFEITEKDKKCFIEELPDDTQMIGKYLVQVFDKTSKEWKQSAPGFGMHVEVHDPRNKAVLSRAYGSQGRFTFTSHLPVLLDEHVVVEELLETLVGVVDKKLLQHVQLEDLKTGNIQHTDEVLSGIGRVQRIVDKSDDPIEHTGKKGLGSGRNGEVDLVNVLTLLDKVLADLQLGLHEGVDKVVNLNLQEIGSSGDHVHAIGLGLLLTSLLLPLLVTNVGDGDGTLVQTILLVLVESEGIQSHISGSHLLGVVHTGNGQHTLGQEKVISGEGLVTQLAELPVLGVSVGHDLVEDVVISLNLELESDTRLLQKVGLNISGGDLRSGAKVNTDELSES